MPECLECHKPFEAAVPWQKFCPKTDAQRKKKIPRSTCANRYSVREHYHRKHPDAKRRARHAPKRRG